MESFIFSKNERKHEEIINESYAGYLNSDDNRSVDLHLSDNSTIVAVNSCIFRIFSPLLNTLLSETSTDVQDIILPDFSVDICTLMMEILTTGKTSIKDRRKVQELKSLANVMNIDMSNLVLSSSDPASGSRVKISSISQKFLEANVSNMQYDFEDGEVVDFNEDDQDDSHGDDVRNNNQNRIDLVDSLDKLQHTLAEQGLSFIE